MTKSQSELQEDAVVFDKSDNEGYQSSLSKGNMDFANEIRLKYFAKSLMRRSRRLRNIFARLLFFNQAA